MHPGKKNTGNKRQPGQSVFRIRFKKIPRSKYTRCKNEFFFFSFSILNFSFFSRRSNNIRIMFLTEDD